MRRYETQNRERFDVDHRAKQRTNLEKIEQKESRRVLTIWRESLVKQGNSQQGMNTAHRHHRDSRAGEKGASHSMQMQYTTTRNRFALLWKVDRSSMFNRRERCEHSTRETNLERSVASVNDIRCADSASHVQMTANRKDGFPLIACFDLDSGTGSNGQRFE